jgi:hypothetical protein
MISVAGSIEKTNLKFDLEHIKYVEVGLAMSYESMRYLNFCDEEG